MVLIHQNPGYSMAELVEKTELTDRQIRRCIAEKLVKGAEGKGSRARYSDETLRRLQLIRRLQEQPVEPLGRQLTLKEIKSTLDSLSHLQEEQILSGMTFSFIDTEAQESDEPGSSVMESKLDREYTDIHEQASRSDRSSHANEGVISLFHSRSQRRRPPGTTFHQGDLGDFGMLLQLLRDKLKILAEGEPAPGPAAGDTWVRVRTRSPIMEIHVKAPESEVEKARLKALHRAVETLIDQGYGPYYD